MVSPGGASRHPARGHLRAARARGAEFVPSQELRLHALGPLRIQLPARRTPARLELRGLLGRKDEPADPSVTHRVRAGPTGVPTLEPRLARRAIEREDPLLAVPILEIADVEVGGLGAEGRRDSARRGMAVVNR